MPRARNRKRRRSAQSEPRPAEKAAPAQSKSKAPVDFIAKVIDDLFDEDDWVQLGSLGSNISKLRPGFDSHLYGHKKLSDLIKAPQRFELDSHSASATGGKALYVRNCKVAK